MRKLLENGSEKDGLLKASYKVFTSKYKLAQGKQKIFVDYPAMDVVNTDRVDLADREADMIKAMCGFYKEMAPTDGIRIMKQPGKSVVVQNNVSKGKIVIPLCGKVVFIESSEELPDRAFEIKDHGVRGYFFFIKPMLFKDDNDPMSPVGFI